MYVPVGGLGQTDLRPCWAPCCSVGTFMDSWMDTKSRHLTSSDLESWTSDPGNSCEIVQHDVPASVYGTYRDIDTVPRRGGMKMNGTYPLLPRSWPPGEKILTVVISTETGHGERGGKILPAPLERPHELFLKGSWVFSRPNCGECFACRRHSKRRGRWCSGSTGSTVG